MGEEHSWWLFSKIVEKRTLHSDQMELQITELPNFAAAPTLTAIQPGARTDAHNRLPKMRKTSPISSRKTEIEKLSNRRKSSALVKFLNLNLKLTPAG
jgi:hypothetical protein